MSHYVYEFLVDSELFSDNFLESSEDKIELYQPLLEKYVSHCIKSNESTLKEIKEDVSYGIRVLETPFKNSYEYLTHNNIMLKSIINDLIITPDPLFLFCIDLENRDLNYFTNSSYNSINYAEELRIICRYLKKMTPFVARKIVKFYPDFIKYDSPRIPILYSPTGFSDCLEKNVMKWMRSKAQVFSEINSQNEKKGKLFVRKSKPDPSNSILIEFQGSQNQCAMFYDLTGSRVIDFDKNTNVATIALNLPTTLPEKNHFEYWVNQSINQTCKIFVEQTKKNIYYAKYFNARFSPQNKFIKQLISKAFPIDDEAKFVEEFKTLPVSFDLNLPSSNNIDRFLDIREDHKSLLTFRNYLNDKIDYLSTLKNEKEVTLASRDIKDELDRKHIPDMKMTLSNLYRSESVRWFRTVAAMGVACHTLPGIASGLTCLGLAAHGYITTKENINNLKNMPGFFWNKIKKNY